MPPKESRKYDTEEKTSTPEGKREYMKAYMRDRRAEQREARELEHNRAKLKIIRELLKFRYVGLSDKSKLIVEPKVKKVPAVSQKQIGTGKRITDTTIETIKVFNKAKPFGTVTVTETVEEYYKPTVDWVVKECRREGTEVSDIKVQRDIKFQLTHDAQDLIARRNEMKLFYLPDRWRSLMEMGYKIDHPEVMVYVEKWRALVAERRAADAAFERFVVACLLDTNMTDTQILMEAKANEEAKVYFNHFIEDMAKIEIAKFRKFLGKSEKFLRGEDKSAPIDVLSPKGDWALRTLETAAKVKHYRAAKELIDHRETMRRQGLDPMKKRKKKKGSTYSVTIDKGGD